MPRTCRFPHLAGWRFRSGMSGDGCSPVPCAGWHILSQPDNFATALPLSGIAGSLFQLLSESRATVEGRLGEPCPSQAKDAVQSLRQGDQ
jgi:hypothetical protein